MCHIVLAMATRLTTCRHLYLHRFSPGMTVSADELDGSSGAALCPVCRKVFSESTIAKAGDQNIVEMLQKCPFADAGCTADFMSYEDLQQHLELVHVHTVQPHGIMLFPPDQTTLLCSSLRPFTAIMPSDTEASPPLELSEWIYCDSEFAEDDLVHLYINDEGQDGMRTTLQQKSAFGQSVSSDVTNQSGALTTSSRLSGLSHTRSPSSSSTRQEAGIPSSDMS